MAVQINGAADHPQSPVSVSMKELEEGTVPFSALEEAFGPDSLGIIVVKDLEPRFMELRRRLLSYSSYLANLTEAELNPSSHYLVGWSRGKDTLKDGRYDTLKGSYYANPTASRDEAACSRARSLYPNLPEYTAANVWPSSDVLPGFREAFEELCDVIVAAAALVARACDRYAVKHVPNYEAGYLERVVRGSVATKARLLHYFPAEPASQPDSASDDDDDWCATHLDHGCLTGLTSAMFVDEAAHPPRFDAGQAQLPPLAELPASPDPKAGLYIHSRSGKVTKVAVPKDCLAFQTGEALQRITRGKFAAVPHFVRGVRAASGQGKVARNTLAVFTQPNLWELVDADKGLDFAGFAKEVVEKNH